MKNYDESRRQPALVAYDYELTVCDFGWQPFKSFFQSENCLCSKFDYDHMF